MIPHKAGRARPQFSPGGAIRSRTSPPSTRGTPTPRRASARLDAIVAQWTADDLTRVFRTYLDHVRDVDGWSPETVRSQPTAFGNFRRFLLETVGPGVPLGRHLFEIEEWIRWNRIAGRGGHTLNTYWRRIRSFFRWLDRQHGLPNPFEALRPPSVPARLPKARSPEECLRILEATEHYPWPDAFERVRNLAVVATALYAGLRRKELVGLKFLDVDLDDGTLRVVGGKGRGGGKDRIVPIASDLRHYLDAYLRHRRQQGIVAPEFFCSRQTKRGISMMTLRRIVLAVRRASGVPFSLHSLRHSFVTQLLRSGVPLHTASALAGHNQITTTAGYLKVFDEDKVQAMRVFSFKG